MNFVVRAFLLLATSAAATFGGTWSGKLVDSKYIEALQKNVNPTDTLTYVDQDTGEQIRYCAPSAKTRQFTIVPLVGSGYRLDAAGNAKAAGLVSKTGKKRPLQATVTGERHGNTIAVKSINALSVKNEDQ